MSVRAMKAGALEFLTKPFDEESLLDALQQGIAWRRGTLRSSEGNPGLPDPIRIEWEGRKKSRERQGEIDRAFPFEEIVGDSPALRTVLARISKVAPTDSTVLITGETGTGKELVARAIHRRSHRALRPFVAVNCAAIPQPLIASELFGHERGAFTGALQRRIGRFELAEGGTLFLDEVGDLPAETQIALLRVLQEREFERIGGGRPIPVDARVIAATHRDLTAAMAAGAFRCDLFYRLNVFPVENPPLRDRKEDIPPLVEHFIACYACRGGRTFRTIDKATLERLQSYAWPGNIRELQNVIERSIIVCESENFSVDESWLGGESVQSEPDNKRPLTNRADDEKTVIETVLAETNGRVSGPRGAATQLGMPPSTLESKIKLLKINKHRFKAI
ncbi:MAG: sigma-54-dependent Fis family transcriptional regulator [Candidatus Manganitrophaceae bacterium]|nr:MAG: sigma-54-dependent Fis family transcriptional regulator [Candidatus Manganitrophaceae bacterium]